MFAGLEDPVGEGRHERPLRAELQGHEVQSTWEVRQANQIAADFKADRTAKTRRVSQEMKRQRLYVGSFAAK